MHRLLAFILLAATMITAAAQDPANKSKVTTSWLWLGEKAHPKQTIYLRKTFTLKDAGAQKGWLVATADNTLEVHLNGVKVLVGKEWHNPVSANVSARLRDGENIIAVKAVNTDSDRAGVLMRLDLTRKDGSAMRIETDDSWKVSAKPGQGWKDRDFDDKDWIAPTIVGKLGAAPWATVTERMVATIGRNPAAAATAAEKIKIKDGFRVELLYSVPREEQGSWVSMCHDPKGRLIVSDQYGGLFRVTPPPVGANQATVVEKLPIDLGEAHGLLWAFDSLYVVVNHGEKYKSGLWRVRSADAEHFDSPELLREFQGNGEHGPHGVLLGPDKKSLYIVIGNHTKLTDCGSSLVPRCWAEDQIVPRMWDAKGHARGILAPGGHIVKTDGDGKNWTLVSAGYRNCYDAAFDREGELFTFDSDMEWDINAPWYRPTRVCHVVSGSEFGWRSGSGKWPTYYPDSLPPVVDIGPGSPTGLTFGTGARFPAKYQDALFCCDWSYGKLYAVHLTPTGATFRGEAEEFLSGLPLPLTDIVINPHDGAMYFAVGGRKTTSGLYRVTYVGRESTNSVTAPQIGGDQRKLRHTLEAFHGKKDPAAVAAAWPHLGHVDRFIRSAARVALEHQDPALWQNRVFEEKQPLAQLTGLLALARVGDKDLREKLLVHLGNLRYEALSDSQKLDSLRALGLAIMRMGPFDEDANNDVISRLEGVYPAKSRELNIELCKLLVNLNAPSVVTKTLPLMAAAATQEEQMDYANALKSATAGWTPELRKQYFGWFAKAAGYRGGNSFAGFVDMIKAEAIAKMTDSDKAALKDFLVKELLEAKPRIAAIPPKPRPFVKKWTLNELVPLVDGQLTGRDFDRGQELFSSTRCVSCHRYHNDGGANGPDLTSVAGRFSVRDLLESTVEPSKVISDQYSAVVIATADGKTLSGRIINLNNDNIYINTDMLDPNAITVINRNLIESMETSKVSMMPDGLIDTCTIDEIKDLIAYLLSRGDRNGPMFKK